MFLTRHAKRHHFNVFWWRFAYLGSSYRFLYTSCIFALFPPFPPPTTFLRIFECVFVGVWVWVWVFPQCWVRCLFLPSWLPLVE